MTDFIDRAFGKLYDLADRLPETKQQPETCLRNILCDCERRNCPGKTSSIKYYAKRLKEL